MSENTPYIDRISFGGLMELPPTDAFAYNTGDRMTFMFEKADDNIKYRLVILHRDCLRPISEAYFQNARLAWDMMMTLSNWELSLWKRVTIRRP